VETSEASHQIIAELLAARTGQHLTESRRWRVNSALAGIFREHGISNVDQLVCLLASPRASEWAPRYLRSLLGNSYNLILARNGGSGTAPGALSETPERLGFVFEAPLRSAFFESYTGPGGNVVSRILANTEQSPNATANAWNITSASNPLTTRINVLPWS
jgi:hypothetical protein